MIENDGTRTGMREMTRNAEPEDEWTRRLSDYVDGEMSRRHARALEQHLRDCAACAAIVRDMRRLVADAPALNLDSEPFDDLWPGIERRLKPHVRTARPAWLTFPVGGLLPRLAASAVVIAFLAVAFLWLRLPPAERQRGPLASRNTPSVERSRAEEEYDATAAALEREARARLALDPRVVEVLEDNLATLDAAISNYRDALTEEPGDRHLETRLATARQRKLDVLRQAVTLSAEGTN
jgi:anti-sigma-K factor RskA